MVIHMLGIIFRNCLFFKYVLNLFFMYCTSEVYCTTVYLKSELHNLPFSLTQKSFPQVLEKKAQK